MAEVDGARAGLPKPVLQEVPRWLCDVLVVQKRFGVLDVAELRAADLVLGADAIIPVHAFAVVVQVLTRAAEDAAAALGRPAGR